MKLYIKKLNNLTIITRCKLVTPLKERSQIIGEVHLNLADLSNN